MLLGPLFQGKTWITDAVHEILKEGNLSKATQLCVHPSRWNNFTITGSWENDIFVGSQNALEKLMYMSAAVLLEWVYPFQAFKSYDTHTPPVHLLMFVRYVGERIVFRMQSQRKRNFAIQYVHISNIYIYIY